MEKIFKFTLSQLEIDELNQVMEISIPITNLLNEYYQEARKLGDLERMKRCSLAANSFRQMSDLFLAWSHRIHENEHYAENMTKEMGYWKEKSANYGRMYRYLMRCYKDIYIRYKRNMFRKSGRKDISEEEYTKKLASEKILPKRLGKLLPPTSEKEPIKYRGDELPDPEELQKKFSEKGTLE